MGSSAVGGTAAVEHTVASITSFAIGKYELKYADWLTVKTWAASNSYSFANNGLQGESGGGTNQHPVTTINWRDAIIWCNAASQMEGLTPVYYTNSGFSNVLKTSTNSASLNGTMGSEDNPYVNWAANGYRLPTEVEWEYSARYIDGITFMRGDAPSGWSDNNPANGLVDAAENYAVAWYAPNSSSVTHAVGSALGNALGLFDMNGNTWEWMWDLYAASYGTGSPFTDADSRGPVSLWLPLSLVIQENHRLLLYPIAVQLNVFEAENSHIWFRFVHLKKLEKSHTSRMSSLLSSCHLFRSGLAFKEHQIGIGTFASF